MSMLSTGLYRAFPCYSQGHEGRGVLIENEIVYLMGSPNYQILEWEAEGLESENYERITLNITDWSALSAPHTDQWLTNLSSDLKPWLLPHATTTNPEE